MPTEEFQGKSEASWYGDFVHQVDHTIGEIMKAVEATGKAEDTIFIVTSDNGSHWRPQDVEKYDHDAHNGRRGMKADAYEAGHRVPLIIRWPGEAPAGEASDALVGLNDIYAMVADVIGHEIAADEAEDSVSFLQAVNWPDNAGQRDHLIHHSVNGSFAIRMGRWKLIDTLGSGGFTEPRGGKAEPGQPEYQLFNMVTDEAEENDVAKDWPTVAENLLEKLAEVKRG
jgi:arylsulfatase A-like enzyme